VLEPNSYSFESAAASPTATLTVEGILIDTFVSVQEAVAAITTTPGSNFMLMLNINNYNGT